MSQLKTRMPKSSKIEDLPIRGEKPKSEKEEKFLREIKTYEFYNVENPGLMLSFPYGSSSCQKTFKFLHGQTYQVPRHVARHLENCSTPMWSWRPNGTGQMVKQKVGEKSRFQMREKFGM